MATRTRHPLARPAIESLEQRLALTISYAIAPGATLDVYPLSSIIPAAPAGMDRMEVLLTSVPGVSHGTLYRVSGTEAYPWGSPAPNIFTVGAGNNRITAGEGFRYVNNGTGDGTTETIPVKFRDGTGFTTATDTIVITVNSHLTPPTITAQPNTFIQIPPGGTATMSVTAAGTPAPTYQWYQGIAPDTSRPIAGATSTSYTTPALSAVQQYVYWVQAKNTGGVANSLVVTVQVATPTTLATTNASAAYSTAAQAVNLSGTVSPAENVGNVTFTSAALNASARSGTVTNGLTGPTGFVIPAGAKAGTYAIAAQYDAPAGIASSTDTKTLTITAAATTTAATASPTAVAATAAQTVALSAKVTSPAGAVNEGTATFTLKNGAVVIGTATTVAVANGAASVGYVLPANTPAGAYAVAVAYNPGADYTASGDATTALKVAPAVTASTAAVQATGGTLTIKGVGFSATAANDSVAFSPAVSGGSVTAATPTSLTYTFASAPPAGTLSAIVTANGVAGTQVQVATVLLLPTWLTPAVPGSAVATWNQARQTLAITGVATLTADPLASGDIPVVTVAGGGGALIVTPASDRQIHVNGLTVADGGQVAVSRTTAAGGPTVFAIGGAAPLSLGSTGKLNLTNNDLVVAGTGLSAVAALVANGAIVSGLTDAAHLHALGVVQNDRGGTPLYTSANPFDGAVPGASDILVKYTYYGDGNLDGRVNAADYTRVDATFVAEMAGPIVTGWFTGDFNADGVVDGSDYALMDNAFNQQGAAGVAATPAVVASPAAEAARPAAPTGRAAATSPDGGPVPQGDPGIVRRRRDANRMARPLDQGRP